MVPTKVSSLTQNNKKELKNIIHLFYLIIKQSQMVLKVWGCVRISRVNAPGMERPTGNHSIIKYTLNYLQYTQ